MNLSAPWEIYCSEIEALFALDDEIHVERNYTEEDKTIILLVDNQDKANALERLLPKEKAFGNVTVQIEIKPANFDEYDITTLYKKAFRGNPVLEDMIKGDVPGSEITFLVFKNKVVRFYADNIRDYQGKRSTLYETIAEDVFEDKEGVFFCTVDSEWGF